MTLRKASIACGPALVALAQMSSPASAGAAYMLVPICGQNNGLAVPIRLPRKDDGPGGAPCCKICHSAMRKRIGGDRSCAGEDAAEDDADAA